MPDIGIEDSNFFQINSFGEGISINKYRGDFSISVARRTENGIFPTWTYPQYISNGRRVPSDRAIPMGTPRTSLETLIDAVEWIHAMLTREPADDQVVNPPDQPTPGRDDSAICPF